MSEEGLGSTVEDGVQDKGSKLQAMNFISSELNN